VPGLGKLDAVMKTAGTPLPGKFIRYPRGNPSTTGKSEGLNPKVPVSPNTTFPIPSTACVPVWCGTVVNISGIPEDVELPLEFATRHKPDMNNIKASFAPAKQHIGSGARNSRPLAHKDEKNRGCSVFMIRVFTERLGYDAYILNPRLIQKCYWRVTLG
jgi:hypothetical protein